MTVRLKGRRRAAERIIDEVTTWARDDDRVRAVVLVGSYARGAERMASDVDLVVLSDTPSALEDGQWFEHLRPEARLIRSEMWGPVRERRFRLGSGLIVELGIAPSSWADVPLDEGTRRVLSDGHRILHDTGSLGGVSTTMTRQGKASDLAIV